MIDWRFDDQWYGFELSEEISPQRQNRRTNAFMAEMARHKYEWCEQQNQRVQLQFPPQTKPHRCPIYTMLVDNCNGYTNNDASCFHAMPAYRDETMQLIVLEDAVLPMPHLMSLNERFFSCCFPQSRQFSWTPSLLQLVTSKGTEIISSLRNSEKRLNLSQAWKSCGWVSSIVYVFPRDLWEKGVW